jgi:thioester reductase-like protein
VESALKSRGLVLGEEKKLLVYAADTSAAKLGLSEAAYQEIAEGVDVILHVSQCDFGNGLQWLR